MKLTADDSILDDVLSQPVVVDSMTPFVVFGNLSPEETNRSSALQPSSALPDPGIPRFMA
jgi:hypothetical protein